MTTNWLQRLQVATTTEDSLCNALVKLDRRLIDAVSQEECVSFCDVDAFLLERLLEPTASLRLQTLSAQLLLKLSTVRAQGAVVSANRQRLWKAALDQDENALKLMPLLSCCQDLTLLRESLVPQLVRWVSTRGFEGRLQRLGLLTLTSVVACHDGVVSEEQLLVICCQLAEWLKGAGVVQASNPHSRRWKKDLPEKSTAILEVDGTPAVDFFTVLNVGQYYTDSQVLNMHTYSMLRTWLVSVKNADIKCVMPLLDAVYEYCSRTLGQAGRSSAKDADLMLATLVESISLMDVVSTLSESHKKRCIEKIKAIGGCIDETSPHAMLAVLQFFLNHACEFAADVINELFGTSLSSHYADSSICFELIRFIKKNLPKLCYDTQCFKLYFPNIFKILAWSPQLYLDDFMLVLPAALCRQTALELLHLLLDLPCLSAALSCDDVVGKSVTRADDGDSSSGAASGADLTALRPWLSYLLRTSSGAGDTIAKLGVLHSAMSPMIDHPRVAFCAQASIILIRQFFKEFLYNCDAEEASHVFQIILERASLLYGPLQFQEHVQRLFCEETLCLLEKFPCLLVTHTSDIVGWLASTRTVMANMQLSMHLAWLVGYYSSPVLNERCTSEVMMEFYETMECLVYEVINERTTSSAGSLVLFKEDDIQLLLVLLTAMTKLACRCQVLAPRVLLCMTKLSKHPHIDAVSSNKEHGVKLSRQYDDTVLLRSRLHELVSLLNVPDVASVILNAPMPSKLNKMHLDNTSTPILLETLVHLL